MTNINIKIPDDVHKKFKIACAVEDVTLKERILKLLEEALGKDDKHKY